MRREWPAFFTIVRAASRIPVQIINRLSLRGRRINVGSAEPTPFPDVTKAVPRSSVSMMKSTILQVLKRDFLQVSSTVSQCDLQRHITDRFNESTLR